MTATAASASASASATTSAATATATAVATPAAATGRLSEAVSASVDLGPVESFSDSSVKVVFCMLSL
jgi:hypothetical protein